MCGILGIVAQSPVNQILYDGLLLLQHRGQDAAGIVTAEHNMFHMHKAPGMVRDVFRTRNMRDLGGNMGIAHCRYPTAGSAFKASEAQPFYVNSPFGIVLGHNGNLTNADQLKEEMFRTDLRHINTGSDSEVLVNVLARELEKAALKFKLEPQQIFSAVAAVHRRVRGAYAVVAMIAGYGVVRIRDSARPSGLQLRAALGVSYREGFVKNRYIGRTFIMPGQAIRSRSVRQKLNPMPMEFSGKNVLLVDDSIVRGTTSREIVQMARESGPRKAFFASAAPPVRLPNVYGIAMPTRAELIAAHRTEEEVCRQIGA